MTATTTAVVMISGHGFGPFSAPGWRVNGLIQVVEGGSSGPLLLPRHLDPDSPHDLGPLHSNGEDSTMIVSALVLVASVFSAEQALCEALVTAQIIREEGRLLRFSDQWRLTTSLFEQCASSLRQHLQLGIVLLEDMTVVTEHVVDDLRALGCTVTLFSRDSE